MRKDTIHQAFRALTARPARRSRRGMSLIEIMVVIAIILTLMGILALGVFTVYGNAQVDMTKLTMTRIAERVQIYGLRHKGKMPSGSEGLEAVFEGDEVPLDAWGREFRFVTPGPGGADFDLMSLGADGVEGGTGNNADIKYSEIK